MKTTLVKTIAGAAIAAALVVAPVTAANAANELKSISVTQTSTDTYTVTAVINKAVTKGTVRATLANNKGEIIKGYGVVASAAKAGTVTFTVPKADFPSLTTNQLVVEVFNAQGASVDGQAGAMILLKK
jgi:predicted transcriptional regulator